MRRSFISMFFFIVFFEILGINYVNAIEYPGQYPATLWSEGNVEETVRKAKDNKVIFLTFDDGPSKNNTPKILRILNEKNVKATFFVIGYKAEVNKDIVKNLKESGMSVFPHSYTHDYKKIYNNTDSFLCDLNKCIKSIQYATGEENYLSLLRFPGGSDNLVCNGNTLKEIKERVKNEGFLYIDWNISSEDATATTVCKDKILNSVKNGLKNINYGDRGSYGVVLMHDSETKTTTVEALPEIIDEFKNNGYKFKTFDQITKYDIQMLKQNRVINR